MSGKQNTKARLKHFMKPLGSVLVFVPETATSQFGAVVATSVSLRSESKCEVSEQGGTTGAV